MRILRRCCGLLARRINNDLPSKKRDRELTLIYANGKEPGIKLLKKPTALVGFTTNLGAPALSSACSQRRKARSFVSIRGAIPVRLLPLYPPSHPSVSVQFFCTDVLTHYQRSPYTPE